MAFIKHNTNSKSEILKALEKRIEIAGDRAKSRRSSPKPARSFLSGNELATSELTDKA